jgi:hypothetical protein
MFIPDIESIDTTPQGLVDVCVSVASTLFQPRSNHPNQLREVIAVQYGLGSFSLPKVFP